ncbi:EcsC family protein [Phycicoccus sp. CSK15P-2]|uniref:EcsC family protein n=1 Tax=Phycicoccus sp. CSK15P-2 TaxID=2807627 RepID=UPI001950BF25|nr:EcsC family protein [Phycicoccus sp. CSK15P-2]MBM6404618.1 EcsC family protein [Phycicoccus sp. CSK15P-2]
MPSALEKVNPLPLAKDLVAAGADAPRKMVGWVLERDGAGIARQVEADRRKPDFSTEEYVKKIQHSHVRLARSEGAGAGMATALAEFGGAAAAGPAGAITGAAVTIVADLALLSRIQIRQTLTIAAAYGFDLSATSDRAYEIMSLHSLEATTSKSAIGAGQKAGQRVGKRLLERYLRGPALEAVKGMFRLVGVNFTRAALVRSLPLVNVPVNAAVADVTTRRVGTKAANYYRDHPSATSTE